MSAPMRSAGIGGGPEDEPRLVQETHDLAFSLSVQASKRGEGDRARDRPDRIALLGGQQLSLASSRSSGRRSLERRVLARFSAAARSAAMRRSSAVIAPRLRRAPRECDRDQDCGHDQQLQPVPERLGWLHLLVRRFFQRRSHAKPLAPAHELIVAIPRSLATRSRRSHMDAVREHGVRGGTSSGSAGRNDHKHPRSTPLPLMWPGRMGSATAFGSPPGPSPRPYGETGETVRRDHAGQSIVLALPPSYSRAARLAAR